MPETTMTLEAILDSATKANNQLHRLGDGPEAQVARAITRLLIQHIEATINLREAIARGVVRQAEDVERLQQQDEECIRAVHEIAAKAGVATNVSTPPAVAPDGSMDPNAQAAAELAGLPPEVRAAATRPVAVQGAPAAPNGDTAAATAAALNASGVGGAGGAKPVPIVSVTVKK